MYTCVVMNTCIYNIPVDALIPIKNTFIHLKIHMSANWTAAGVGFFLGGGVSMKYLTKN